MTLIDMIKSLADDFIRQRWGDLVAMSLILLGVWLVMHGATEVVADQGKALGAAGLLALRPRTMPSDDKKPDTLQVGFTEKK